MPRRETKVTFAPLAMSSRNFFASKEKRSEVAEEAARRPIHLNQRTPVAHLFFGPYVFFPVLAMGTWLGGLLALLGLWVQSGKPRYQNDEASVVFISDVGGELHVSGQRDSRKLTPRASPIQDTLHHHLLVHFGILHPHSLCGAMASTCRSFAIRCPTSRTDL